MLSDSATKGRRVCGNPGLGLRVYRDQSVQGSELRAQGLRKSGRFKLWRLGFTEIVGSMGPLRPGNLNLEFQAPPKPGVLYGLGFSA